MSDQASASTADLGEHLANVAYTLLLVIEDGSYSHRPVMGALVRTERMEWALGAEDFLTALADGSHREWLKLLDNFASPPVRVISIGAEAIDLYARFKRASPFADAQLVLDPGHAEPQYEQLLHDNGWCSQADEFAFVVYPAGVGQVSVKPVWLRPRSASNGRREDRTGPVHYSFA